LYCNFILVSPPLGGASKGHGESDRAIQATPRVVGRTTFESPCPSTPVALNLPWSKSIVFQERVSQAECFCGAEKGMKKRELVKEC
jgi:hypothetical protein